MVSLDIVLDVIAYFFVNICIYYIINKMSPQKDSLIRKILMYISCLMTAIIYSYLKMRHNIIFSVATSYFLYSIFLSKITDKKLNQAIMLTVIALVLSLAFYFVSVVIFGIIFGAIFFKDGVSVEWILVVAQILQGIVQILFANLFFKVRRFKNGFYFLEDNMQVYENVVLGFLLAISSILAIYLIPLYYQDKTSNKRLYILATAVLTTLALIEWIRKEIRNYYNIKQMEKTIEIQDMEAQIKEIEIEKLSNEVWNLGKIIHDTKHQIAAMRLLVEKNNSNYNEEATKDNNVIEEIEKLKEKIDTQLDNNIKSSNVLPLTKIITIDSMFELMMNEARKNNIELNLNIKGNVNYMLEKYIEKDELEVLIGSHIKNAIVAINSEDKVQRKILVMLGKIDDNYGIKFFDTGANFEIKTLLELGQKRSTTHKDTGGTGIGFMTTFDTLRKYRASIIIEEKKPKQIGYTKSIMILFDNKNRYKIKSYRADEIKRQSKARKIAIEQI